MYERASEVVSAGLCLLVSSRRGGCLIYIIFSGRLNKEGGAEAVVVRKVHVLAISGPHQPHIAWLWR